MKRDHLPALTGLRFFAALAVVCCHFQQWRPGLLTDPSFAWGDQAVGLFFVLSGFILARTYLIDGSVRGGVRAFAVARVARIYPVYVAIMGFAVAPFLWDGGWDAARRLPGAVLSSLSLLPAWNPGRFASLDGPAWSLGAEAFFYATFPLLGVGIARLPRRVYPWLLGALYAWSLALPAWYLLHVRIPYEAFPLSLYFFPPSRLPEFLMGVVLGCWLRGGMPPRTVWGLQLGALAALAWGVQAAQDIPEPWTLTGLFSPIWLVLIAGLAGAPIGLSAVLAHQRIVLLGEASYGLYLLHAPLWILLSHLLGIPVLGWVQGGWFVAALYLLFAATGAITLYRRVEVPARRAIRAWVAPLTATAAQPPPTAEAPDAIPAAAARP